MTRVTRDRGWLAVCVYGKGGYYDSPRVTAWRKLFHLLRPVMGNYPPLAYAYGTAYAVYPLTHIPVLGHFLRLVFPMMRLPDRRWRVLDTFDSVTPTYQTAHESYEVFRWFRESGLTDVEPSDWGFSAFHGLVPVRKQDVARRAA